MVQRDLQLSHPVRRILARLSDLQVLLRDGFPASPVSRQLVHQFVLAGQRQAEAGLSPVSESQPPPLAARLRTAALAQPRHGQQPLPQQAVQHLILGVAVLSQDDDVGDAAHRGLQVLLLVAEEGEAAQVTWRGTKKKTKELRITV